MLDLMAVEPSNGVIPLYMYTVQRILREMRITQQINGSTFDYLEFKTRVLNSGLIPTQLEPLKQRLEALESFMPQAQTLRYPMGRNQSTKGKGKAQAKVRGTSWKPAVRNELSFHTTPLTYCSRAVSLLWTYLAHVFLRKPRVLCSTFAWGSFLKMTQASVGLWL